VIRTTLQSALCLCLAPLLVAQQAMSDNPGTNPPANAAIVTLRKGTVVALALIDPLSSATAQKGQTVRLALAEDVIVNGVVAIRRGATALGVIKSVSKAIPGKHNGYLQIEPVSFTPQDMSSIALNGYTPPGGDDDCSFGSCLLLLIPYSIAGIVEAVKAPFRRHHSPVAQTPVAGKDFVLCPCSRIWGATVAASQIINAMPDPFQPSQAAVDFDTVCPA
jgi:hypothetical protein